MINLLMRWLPRILALPMCLWVVAFAYAHPGHDDALTTLQAVMRGKAIVRRLVETGEPVRGEILEEHWNHTEGPATCGATPIYYLVTLESYRAGKTLYILLNHNGRFLRARFDAGFAELKFSSFPIVECTRY